jgi:hypothetical protein
MQSGLFPSDEAVHSQFTLDRHAVSVTIEGSVQSKIEVEKYWGLDDFASVAGKLR